MGLALDFGLIADSHPVWGLPVLFVLICDSVAVFISLMCFAKSALSLISKSWASTFALVIIVISYFFSTFIGLPEMNSKGDFAILKLHIFVGIGIFF